MKSLIAIFFFFVIAFSSSAQTYMADGRSHLVPLPSASQGIKSPVSSLNGVWEINTKAGETFNYNIAAGKDWKPIQVPGEAMMQGVIIKNDVPFVYRKKISLPAGAAGKKHLIRFNGVYSYGKVYFNGQLVREHFGGFTAWDCDITAMIKPGQDNWLYVVVVDRTDDISYASGYAHHPIGGILRNVEHIVLPGQHIQRLYAHATLENNYQRGKLSLDLSLNQPGKTAKIEWNILDPAGKMLWSKSRTIPVDENGNAKDEITIASVKKWTAETPHLYKLKINLLQDGKLLQTVEEWAGFRTVGIDAKKQLLVNGKSVKLRGACRHDMHPLLGRSTNRAQDSLDVVLAKEANLNFIRTSHYPPSRDFLEFCDRYGLYVQEETAICFVLDWREEPYKKLGETQDDPAFTGRYLGQLSEMIDRDRNHAAVIMWSIGNESNYGVNFQKEYEFVKSVDLSRPVSWSWPNTALNKGKRCFDIAVSHYPQYNGSGSDMGGIEKNMVHPDFPVIGDEWAHVACYNVELLAFDPNVKDFWGRSLDTMWISRFDVEGNIGGAIWGMIDETFHLKDTVTGYGPWGFIDVWRRKKPEFWNTKKAYSPIRVMQTNLVDKNGMLEIPVKNRFDHTNLNEIKAFAVVDGKSSALSLPSIAPHEEGVIRLPYKNKEILLQFHDARGKLIDEELINRNAGQEAKENKNGEWKIAEANGKTVLSNDKLQVEIDHRSGLISQASINGNIILKEGPVFTVNQPKNPNALKSSGEIYSGAYQADTFYVSRKDKSAFVFHTKGKVDKYPVELITTLYPNGIIETQYSADSIPSQTWEIGLKFPVAKALNTIEWNRKGYWSTYPADHLSAIKGKAVKHSAIKEAYRTRPGYSVEKSYYDYYLTHSTDAADAVMAASEIYRAKKENILRFSVHDSKSLGGKLTVLSDGKQAAKMSVQKDDSQYLLVADKWDYWSLSWGNYQGEKNTSTKASGKVIVRLGE